ncbi:hypothetical protein [Saccharopolyspora shandongensis]|uniref:hypothetical protein n=1 Tax=Saccharopolyspora shandongensis TaxID=418495 RepID=UPI0033EF44DF
MTSVAAFMATLDVTIVNIAFPGIERSFSHDSLGDLSWVLNAYNIVSPPRWCLPGDLPTGWAASACSWWASCCS